MDNYSTIIIFAATNTIKCKFSIPMKDFNWTSFTRKINIKSDVPTLYNAWTKSSEIEKWFLKESNFSDTVGNIIDKNESLGENQTYAWEWYGYDDVENGKIIQANGKDALQFTFAGNCLVTVNFTQEKDFVIVTLTQSNIPTDEDAMRNIRLGCHAGWSFFLVNLKSIYEGGIDLRNKDEELKGMLNN